MYKSTTLFRLQDTPTLFGLIIIGLSLLMFGGDTRAARYLISGLVFAALLVSMLAFEDFYFENWMTIPLGCLIIFFGVHWFTDKLSGGMQDYQMLFAGAGMFWLARHSGHKRSRRSRVFKWLSGAAVVYCLLAFLQHILAPELILGQTKTYHLGRLTGTFLSANTAASLFGAFAIFALYRLGVAWSQTSSGFEDKSVLLHSLTAAPISLALLFLSCTNLLLTGSRAGLVSWLAAGLAFMGVVYLMQDRQQPNLASELRRNHIPIIGFASIFLLVAWLAAGSLMDDRLANVANDFDTRQIMLGVSWKAGQQAPILGHGLGGFNHATAFVATPQTNLAIINQNAAHNLFAQWFVQVGWFGVLGILVLITALGMRALTSDQNSSLKGVQIGLLLGFVGHAMFDYALEIPAIFLFASFIFGLLSTQK